MKNTLLSIIIKSFQAILYQYTYKVKIYLTVTILFQLICLYF
jgi:hypothetical protein